MTAVDFRPEAETAPEVWGQLQLTPEEATAMFKALGVVAREGLLTWTSFDLATLDEPLTYERYAAVGRALGAINRSCAWWVGDWLVYGEGAYEGFAQAASETGLAEQTLINRAYVCRHVPPQRRIQGIEFGVHALVAAMTAREQKKWLAAALKNGWGREDLRRALRETKATDRDDAPLPGPGEPLAPGLVLEAAVAVVKSRKDYGGDWLVPKDAMARLIAAVGEEE